MKSIPFIAEYIKFIIIGTYPSYVRVVQYSNLAQNGYS